MPSSVATSSSTDPAADVLLAVLGPVLVLVVAWLLLSVALSVLAVAAAEARRPTLSRFLRSLAVSPVRNLVERTVTVSVAVSLAASVTPWVPAAAAPATGPGTEDSVGVAAPVEEPVVRGADDGSLDPGDTPIPSPTSTSDHGDGVVPDAPARPDTHVVAPGENLWSVSARVLAEQAAAIGRSEPVDDPEIACYWSRLIDLNRSTLRSGDPDLVFPGERLTLPSA